MAPPKQIPTCFKGPVQVIAAGLPRCATTTLKEVFENPNFLDVGPTMHMNRCLTAPANMQFIMEALREPDAQKRRAILYKLFAGCAATADFPGHLFIEDLIEMYPDAKVVLNVRKSGAQDWAASMSTTIAPFMGWQYRTACYLSQPDYWHYQCEVEWQRSVQERFGVKNFWDAEVYEKHNQWVLDICREKGKEVLIWEPSMGWAQLCEFLGKKVPENGIPRTNDRGKMEKIVLWRISIGLKMWATKVVAPIALSVFGSWGLMRATNLEDRDVRYDLEQAIVCNTYPRILLRKDQDLTRLLFQDQPPAFQPCWGR